MRLLKKQLRSKLKPFMAMFLAFLTVIGTVPVFAGEGRDSEIEPFIARIYGEEVLVPADGIVLVNVAGFDEPIEMEIPRYIYLDGEAVSTNDDRIENIAPVLTSPAAALSSADDNPDMGFIVSISGTLPTNPVVAQIGQEYTHPAYVRMNSRIVSSRRYVVVINGVSYESFCADPNLPGPETNAAIYELTGADGSRFRTVLRYGFPINPALTDGLSNDSRAWNAYVTRVAVAYISRPNATWTNLTGDTGSAVDQRINGTGGVAAKAASPAITVNGEINTGQDGFEQQSPIFTLGHSRRTNCQRNPFRFEWAQGTPAGTRLYVDGSHAATAPENLTDVFTVNNPGGSFRAAAAFHFVMPAGSQDQTARINLIGINNQYAGRVFVMQNPNDTEGWQDVVFYIPEVSASAAYTWGYAPYTDDSYGSLLLSKRCSITGVPLANAEFRVVNSSGAVVGNANGLFRTNAQSEVLIPNLPPDSYVVTELRAPDGFILDSTPQTIRVDATGQVYRLEFTNQPLSNLIIRKTSEVDGSALAGAVFEVRRPNGEYIGTFTTGQNGSVEVPNTLGYLVITETIPPQGYTLATVNTRTVEVRPGTPTVVEFTNPRLPSTAIRKISGDDGRPLAGVVFEVSSLAGERIRNPQNNSFEFVTDSAGMIFLPQLPPGTYIARETRPLPGYRLAEPYIFIVGNNQNTILTIRNYKMPSVVIRKICGDTGRPLPGVVFEFARYFGNGNTGQRLKNYRVDNSYEFVTDASGHIYLPTLEDGVWIAIETRPLPGFRNDTPGTTFRVGENGDHTVIIRNYRYPDLTIRKINSITRQPIQGVVFQIVGISGERVTNPQTGFFDFTTDSNGLIHLPAMPDGTFFVTETRSAQGYFGLDEAVVLNINSQTRQQDYLLVIENTPASGLLIIKTDANTGRPLQGVEFEIRHADGRLVRGLMADQNQPGTHANSPNIAPNGNFITDHRGMIHLNHLEAGVYHITETRALPGYQPDSTVHVVTITPGRLTTLEVVNARMAGLRLLKIDSVTRQGIQGVEFRIFDFITNQEVAGPFITDNSGVIDFTGILPPGRYTIRETREAPGYLRDTMPRTVEFRAGMMTEIVWENTREAGQIQITKLSSADNQVNGLPAGSRLAGAVFEVRDWRTGNVMDQFTTDARGVGVSRPLPLGRYLIEEIVAPAFYRRSDVVLDVTIEHSGQILRYEFFNEPANVGVEVRKTGPVEVMSGQPIVWNITTIANSSTIELSDFFVRDILPAHAVRLDRIFTGTFNQSLRYSIMFRTNLNDTWRVAYDNLLSTTNNALVMSPAALGLRSNEHVTENLYCKGEMSNLLLII